MTPSGFPVAHTAAVRVRTHFEHHLAAAANVEGADKTCLPDTEAIQAIVEAAFWTSLQREEGYVPRISLAFVPPDHVKHALRFERPLPLASGALTRMAPAVERPGIHLGVWREQNELRVWGATRNLPALCFVLEVIAPGLLVIKHNRGDESGKFVNVAVLQGDQIKVVDQAAAKIPDCPDLLTSLLGFDSHFDSVDPVNVMIQLAVSMRAHGRGGSLLVVPADTQTWQDSILQPITYSVVPAFSVLTELMQEDPDTRGKRRWQDAQRRAIDAIAGLTAVDGATVITNQYQLLAFGGKIMRKRGSPQVDRVVVTEPIEGAEAEIVEPAQLGGTRHLSAAQFVQDQRDVIALVASQDGRFTVFAWSPCEQMVHAHRIEVLLM